MQRCYRGVHHHSNPLSLEVQDQELIGHYRGLDYVRSTPHHIPVAKTKPALCYRRVSYNICPEFDSAVPIQASAGIMACHPFDPIPAQPMQANHLANLRRNLERRIQAAQIRGDQSLMSLLQQESMQLAL
ncbi:MAG: DUF4278 domain-containing protein [Spirulina sp. DLM2.Bin59]|nr:MAG: DUF4278 domain-containing protein [Spirulina sp. DLM2.Bin59]